ncbi:MAG: D-aminoacyl-tRNA deacylase [Syntrophomonadaceae bacterium]|nr:D-aminoacyl-tRNA deacylase [Syntrophomonadaceae bacterium]
MRAVVQRVSQARVLVEEQPVAQIGPGLVVLLGVRRGDGSQEVAYLADKVFHLRVFEDEQGKMNRSLADTGGQVLVVSQFTLYGDARKGRRPGFSDAALPEEAAPLVDAFAARLAARGVEVRTGVFGAHMQVELCNDGPCTLLLDSERVF